MMETDKKIFYEINALMDEIVRSHGPEKKIVLANGCFDILHVGHVRYLSEAAEYGDILVVAINDDASTRRLKGGGRPVIPGDERAEILTALSSVDYVLLFSESTVDGIIRELRPSVHAKGTDYTEESVPEAGTAMETGCRTVITGDPKDHSSGDIIKKMREE
ncbi:MAG: adenylyltransferase/cytidyltransferase family protein [Bacteroidales bacterium]|nr:adenylyltransferase/cytidyltransferase family protein [Candidatus Latescibacterota bacterium]